MYKERENKAGYAKIEGPNVHVIVTKTKLIIGRITKTIYEDLFKQDEQVLLLADNPRISRRHLLIYFDYNKHEWYLQNYSKNPVFVNKQDITNSDPPVCISPIAAIQVDTEKFYFFQSREEN